jgi:excisionase family DNA binding protein
MTPRDVAKRWQCSERHVRNVLRKGTLRYFKLGEKLVRIPVEAVEEYEKCQSSALSSTEENLRLNGMKKAADSAARSARMTVVRRTTP